MIDELTEEVYLEELKQFEKLYYKQLYKQNVSPIVQFEYARSLVRSRYPADIKKGILFLEELCNSDHTERREYFYYLAIGNARIKEYTKALKYVRSANKLEPNNTQIVRLEGLIKNRIDKEGLITMALAGGTVIVIGIVFLIGVKLLRK